MSGYGTCTWTCGRCGDSYSASGVVGDMKVDRFRRDHLHGHEEQDKLEKMNPEERNRYCIDQMRAEAESRKLMMEWMKPGKRE